MIRLEGLKKYFTITKGLMKKKVTYVKAVDDISLEIKKGEIVGLVGESGNDHRRHACCSVLLKKPEGKLSLMTLTLIKQLHRI